MTDQRWTLHPDRALPGDPGTRSVAREIYSSISGSPIVSMHGHVEADLLAANQPFGDPAEVLIVPDHYLVRMLVSQGVPHDALGIRRRDGGPVETDPRAIFRSFAENWHLFLGTPTRVWMEHVLVEILGVRRPLDAGSADEAYDQIAETLARDDFRPLTLLDTFGIDVLATTDPATSLLVHHADLAERGWRGRIVPTFRPDPLLQVDLPGWLGDLTELEKASGLTIAGYADYVEALEHQRAAFVALGGTATDHSAITIDIAPLSSAEAARIFDAARAGSVTTADAVAFRGHMLFEMARMSTQDGLVMQLHPGVLRNYDTRVLAERGPDAGYDIPVAMEFTRSLRPLLNAFGHDPRFRLILFTIDEDVYSRELAPLAGVYPSVRLGAPWWFLDSPDGMRRARESVTETAGFYNTTGFVDDTRAFFSIPARHDLARRIDAGYLARLVVEHRITMDEALVVAHDLTVTLPRRAYTRTVED